jgi:hypothetical protein
VRKYVKITRRQRKTRTKKEKTRREGGDKDDNLQQPMSVTLDRRSAPFVRCGKN